MRADSGAYLQVVASMKRVYVRDERVVPSGFTAQVDKHTSKVGYAPPTRLTLRLAEPASRCGDPRPSPWCWQRPGTEVPVPRVIRL
jgi:hypothetical protein